MLHKIDLMVLGAQKAGTTSLNQYLQQHPKIATHNTIEFGMFVNEASYRQGFDYYFKHSVEPSVQQDKDRSRFVAKRVGLMNNPHLMKLLYDHNPDVKVVVVLRHPIARAYSAFQYCRSRGMEPYTSFEDAIFINDPARFKGNEQIQKNCEYILRSQYLSHLKNVAAIFPAENIKVFLLEEMSSNMQHALNEMCTSVGLTTFQFDTSVRFNEQQKTKSVRLAKWLSPGGSSQIKNLLPLQYRTRFKNLLRGANLTENIKKESKEVMEESTRRYLTELFSQDVRELASFTNLPLSIYWPDLFI
jgi:hypothetical protein